MRLEDILTKSLEESELSKAEIRFLLEQTEKKSMNQIFEAARTLRERYFGSKVFLYGFVYFSTYCKNDCTFCFFRKSNDIPPRYRKSVDQIVNTAIELKDAGIHLIDLTMGEDPYYDKYPDKLIEIVKRVKEATQLPVMISPGVVKDEVIDQLAYAGVDWYALYQETHNKELYQSLRLNQDYQSRMHAKEYAKKRGMLIEEGLLVGVGNQIEDTIDSFEAMKKLEAEQVRTMTFIPQKGSPMEDKVQSSFHSELLNIAIMRLIFPKALIPASLDVNGLNGLEERLEAGANVVTSIIPPKKGFAGVANATNDINEGYRTIEGIQECLIRCGLQNASAIEYKEWTESRKESRTAV